MRILLLVIGYAFGALLEGIAKINKKGEEAIGGDDYIHDIVNNSILNASAIFSDQLKK